jgi:hypothetical protein
MLPESLPYSDQDYPDLMAANAYDYFGFWDRALVSYELFLSHQGEPGWGWSPASASSAARVALELGDVAAARRFLLRSIELLDGLLRDDPNPKTEKRLAEDARQMEYMRAGVGAYLDALDRPGDTAAKLFLIRTFWAHTHPPYRGPTASAVFRLESLLAHPPAPLSVSERLEIRAVLFELLPQDESESESDEADVCRNQSPLAVEAALQIVNDPDLDRWGEGPGANDDRPSRPRITTPGTGPFGGPGADDGWRLLFQAAQLVERSGRPTEAIRAYRQLLVDPVAVGPTSLDPRVNLAHEAAERIAACFDEMGDTRQALAWEHLALDRYVFRSFCGTCSMGDDAGHRQRIKILESRVR